MMVQRPGQEIWASVDRSWLAWDSPSPRKESHKPLLASWYLRLAWALSRARTRYWLFSFSMSWLWVWERRGQCGGMGPQGTGDFHPAQVLWFWQAGHLSPSSGKGLGASGAQPLLKLGQRSWLKDRLLGEAERWAGQAIPGPP